MKHKNPLQIINSYILDLTNQRNGWNTIIILGDPNAKIGKEVTINLTAVYMIPLIATALEGSCLRHKQRDSKIISPHRNPGDVKAFTEGVFIKNNVKNYSQQDTIG